MLRTDDMCIRATDQKYIACRIVSEKQWAALPHDKPMTLDPGELR